jgi:cyclopropane fatty-acyl-phospholipid synthase-like methyltransferase
LLEVITGPEALPVGKVLDIGCGTGIDSVFLATRGWEVTGVEMEHRAVQEAQKRAQAAGVPARFVRGDVTKLADLGIGTGFTLLLDIGCFHTLPRSQRDRYVQSVTAAAAPDATLLLFTFTYGASPDEIRRRFEDGWDVLWERPGTARRFLKPHWYRMRRRMLI